MKINIKTNVKQYLIEKNKHQSRSYKDIPKCNPINNILKQKNYYSKNNNNKKANYIKLAKLNSINSIKNTINYNNSSSKNNIFIDLNDVRKSNTIEKKIIGSNDSLEKYKENQILIGNKKIMVKHNPYDIKKYMSIQKYPQYDNASFRKAIKYYTLKSDSKTIQEEDLTNYFRPIRNILRVKNIQKVKEQKNKINSDIFIKNNNLGNINKENNNCRENKNKSINYKTNRNYIKNIYINLFENENKDINLMETFNNTNNTTNSSYLQNCYFNKNSLQIDRMNKISKIPFNIKAKHTSKAIKIINNNNNISDTIYYKNNNSKNISDYDTQISINNNANNTNKKGKEMENNSKTLYQFRPRKIHLPKTGINLSSIPYKNKILQNILNKRRKNKG